MMNDRICFNINEDFTLIVFKDMMDEEKLRMIRSVYSEGCRENASFNYPDKTDLSDAIKEEEQYFSNFLKQFFQKECNTYYILEKDGEWLSALRLTEIEKNFYYLEALETAENHRKKGYAARLVKNVIALLEKNGNIAVRSSVDKENIPSLSTHKKCGFIIEAQTAFNYIYKEKNDSCYGMKYATEKI